MQKELKVILKSFCTVFCKSYDLETQWCSKDLQVNTICIITVNLTLLKLGSKHLILGLESS